MPLPQLPAVGDPSRVQYASDTTIVGFVVLNPDGTVIGGSGGGTVSISQSGTANGVQIVGAAANGNTTSTSTVRGTEGPITVTAGALSFEMILSSDFVGTINGAAVDNTSTLVVGVFRLDAPPWKPLAAVIYTITAGSAIRTVQT